MQQAAHLACRCSNCVLCCLGMLGMYCCILCLTGRHACQAPVLLCMHVIGLGSDSLIWSDKSVPASIIL